MNDLPNMGQFTGQAGAGGQPRALTRATGVMRTLLTAGAVATVSFMVAQVVLPDGYKPSDIFGDSVGRGEVYDIKEKGDVVVGFNRRNTDAQAQAQAKAQADIIAMQQAAQVEAESLQIPGALAGLADMVCNGARMVAGAGSMNTGADWHDTAVGVAQSTCNVGSEIRRDMTESLLDAVRSVAAARGMSMNNGAAGPASR